MADATLSVPNPAASAIEIRRITLEDIRIALRQGWADYADKRGEMLMLGLIYPLVAVLTIIVTFEGDLTPVAFPLVAGLSLLGPAVASGFYELARRRENGDDPRWVHAFDLFTSRRFPSIAILTAFMGVIFVLWMVAAWGIYSFTLGDTGPMTTGQFLRRAFTTSAGLEMIVIGNLVGLVFAVAVLVISAVSFPMLVDGKVGPLTAAETSIRAVTKNPMVFAAWGLVVAALLVLGSIPLFVGLAVVLPVLGYASWHLFTRVVVR